MAVLGYLPKLKRRLGIAFGAHFLNESWTVLSISYWCRQREWDNVLFTVHFARNYFNLKKFLNVFIYLQEVYYSFCD